MSELHWRKVDDYHMRSACGRFSIARVNAEPQCWYIAWRLTSREAQPSTELGATVVPMDASDGERLQAIHDMKQLCEAANEPAVSTAD